MERKNFNTSPCAIARSLDVLGDWWNPLILRECLYGNSRFDDFQFWLDISRNILTRRLADLVKQGLLEKKLYQSSPARYQYLLTDKGYEACQIVLAMMHFGERWYFKPNNQPVELIDRTTGEQVEPIVVDKRTGKPLDASNTIARPGPGFKAPKHIVQRRFKQYFESGH